MTTSPKFDYTFSKEADYSSPKEQRKDGEGRCYEPYIPSDGLVEAVQLAIDLKRPLLLEGEPGCGKTRLAGAIVYQLTQNNLRGKKASPDEWWPFYTWTVKSYTRARDGLYTFDAVGRLRDAQMANMILEDTEASERSKLKQKIQDSKKYREFGALGDALREQGKRAVVLIDEVDKADSDFANDLLLELDEFRFEIPETDEKFPAPEEPPIIILTSNREKPLPDAFLRRCLYFNIAFPSGDELKDIARQRLTTLSEEKGEKSLLAQATAKFEEVREAMRQPGSRPPGTSEYLEFLEALRRRSDSDIEQVLKDLPNQLPLLGILLKTKADQELYAKKAALKAQKTGGAG